MNELQALAEEKGIGEVYRRLRDEVRGIFSANGYSQTDGYTRRLENGGVRTMSLVRGACGDDEVGMGFTVHGTHFERVMNVGLGDPRASLPENAVQCDVSGWSGSSPEERESALGIEGHFRTVDEVDAFVKELRSWAK